MDKIEQNFIGVWELDEWVGTTLTRRHEFTLKNKSLTLSAESNGFKDFLVWKKV